MVLGHALLLLETASCRGLLCYGLALLDFDVLQLRVQDNFRGEPWQRRWQRTGWSSSRHLGDLGDFEE
jgi:hypothetical protein